MASHTLNDPLLLQAIGDLWTSRGILDDVTELVRRLRQSVRRNRQRGPGA